MIELVLKGVLCYLLGSVVGSLLIGRFLGIDIRSLGSGNAGATNMLRTQGKAVALWVFLIDLGKGWVATGLIAPAAFPGPAPAALAGWSVPVCGLAVMLGHVYPLWYGFRGGKAVATFVGVALGLSGWLVLAMALTWLAAVILSGFVGFASILGAIAVAVVIAAGDFAPRAPLLALGILAALFILYTHRANIARMRAGTESRAKRLWLLGARRNRA